ncbi:MAG: MBL fold metallo-hydrolase [Oscillospiraceae bacterium]|nr:MBL fold metallo-hydrolase [Oscillospiraceae bacterium]
MKVTHIYHSGYAVELENTVLIFDWYTGKLPEFDRSKEVYVFVSHRHGDHYGDCIWKLGDIPGIKYILDENIKVRKNADITYVTCGREYTAGNIRFRTFLSTDEGVAFLVYAEGKKIYHAGDLNLWYWDGEPDEDNDWQIRTYKREIDSLADILGEEKLDVAMVTFDPRQEDHIADGINYFESRISAESIYLMHYWDDEAEVRKYFPLIADRGPVRFS